MTRDSHDDRLGNAGLTHVGIEGMPQAVKHKTVLYKPPIRNSSIFACLFQGFNDSKTNSIIRGLDRFLISVRGNLEI